MKVGKPLAVRAGKMALQVALLLVLAGCPNFVSIDQLAAAIGGDITSNAAKLVVTQGATALASGSGNYSFGSVVADGISGNFEGSAITFTVKNGGGSKSSLTVNSVSISGTNASDFVLATGTLPVNLSYNDSRDFTITYDPNAIGSSTATVKVVSSDPNTPNYTFKANGTGAAFSVPYIAVPAATGSTFTIGFASGAGSEAATNPHVVTLAAFNIGAYEVTYEQWSMVKTWAAGHGYTFSNQEKIGDGRGGASVQEPVTKVSWFDAVVWCNAASELAGLTPVYYTDHNKNVVYKNATDTSPEIAKIDSTIDTNACAQFTTVSGPAAGYRLPTEAEWEFAARWNGSVVTDGDRPGGDTSHSPTTIAWDSYGWSNSNSTGITHVGGLKAANRPTGGAFDMAGNVYEWCWDWFKSYVAGTVADPQGPGPAPVTAGSNRVLRGGSLGSTDPTEMATSYRNLAAPPSTVINTLGFRIAWR